LVEPISSEARNLPRATRGGSFKLQFHAPRSVVTLRAIASTPFRRTQNQKLPFPFSKDFWGAKKG